MAASSSSSGHCWKYDVFLNFRGDDTRKIFVGHLYKALEQKALNTFIDSEGLRKGNDLSELLKAINDSRLSIVVFSENYASSTWCLKELVQILKCMDMQKQIVVPIFYQVDPCVVRKLKRSFAEALTKHERDSNAANMEEVESWKSALNRATNLCGWDSRNYEDDATLIGEVVVEIFIKLMGISPSKANGLVGMDSHICKIRWLLCLATDDVRTIGIWGMGGIGKTTIARAVYDQITHQFEHSCFLENVKECFLTRNGALQIQEELLSRIFKENRISGALDRGSKAIMEKLGKKKVLLVLDDVDNLDQIETLIGKKPSFGGGSRIIITTRDKHLLGKVEIYEPNVLRDGEALELFRQYAFRTNESSAEYDHLSRYAIKYAHGLPLALKVLGAFLDNKSVREWEDELEKIKKIPNTGIQGVLRTSFDRLDDSQKNIFLDIACFFRGYDKQFVTKILDSFGFFPHSGLRVLVDRALVTVSHQGVQMHDLIQEMGRDIVHRESAKDPGRRSRLWSYEDVHQVLTQNTGTEAVEGLILDLKKSNETYMNTEGFVNMTKLRLLMIVYRQSFAKDEYKQDVSRDFKFLSPELRCLIWDGFPLKSLPSNFVLKNLIQLSMVGSHIEQLWEGTKPFRNLKHINLSYSQYLKKTPDFTEAPNLVTICLVGCRSLLEVHPSISALKKLVSLTLQGCEKLKILPRSIHMKALQTLDLSLCSNLEKFPEIPEDMKELSKLELYRAGITELPSSINNLTGLDRLSLHDCRELKSLPRSIHMKSLKTLNLSGCSKFERFPEISEVMKELRKVHLDETAIKELPSSINNLTGLTFLILDGCRELRSLPSSIHMKSLEVLNLSGCSNLKRFPEISEVMKELRLLQLDGTAINELPSSINNLTGLVYLTLKDCRELSSLPSSIHMKSLEVLDLSGCSNLEVFPEIPKVMMELSRLYLDDTAIEKLPSSIERLQGLASLTMRNCRNLVCLPDNICHLASLEELCLAGCSKLSNLPENLGNLQCLRDLQVEGSGIKQLPFSIFRLGKLKKSLSCNGCKELTAPFSSWPSSIQICCRKPVLVHLDLSDCNMLELSDGVTLLFSLKTLKLCKNNLESLPATMDRLHLLTDLELEGCKRLISIPELPPCVNYIDAHNCTALETVSTRKRPYEENFCFTFSNCFKLVLTTPFHEIVENHFLHQDNQLQPLLSRTNFDTSLFKHMFNWRCRGFSVTLPGSQIPDWFNHQCRGSSVTVRLPPMLFFSKFLGIAICAVSNNNASLQSTSCVCTLKGNHAEESFSFPLLNRRLKTERLLESDHLFLAYNTYLIGKREDERIYTEATFRLVVVDNGVSTNDLSVKEECNWIKSCGVRLFHVNHEEVQTLSPTQPKIHVGNLTDNYNETGKKSDRQLEVEEVRKPGVGVQRAICCCFPSSECTNFSY